MGGDFIQGSMAEGFKMREFSGLTEEQQENVLVLLSRISEKSFRRGFQHGHFMRDQERETVNPVVLRYDAPIDDSPDPDSKSHVSMTALERLWLENAVLTDLGFTARSPVKPERLK